MKILFCSRNPLRRELGAPRVLLELGDALRPLGWECEYAGPPELGLDLATAGNTDDRDIARATRDYLLRRAGEFDVVDYDLQYLPYPRSDFPAGPRFVARSVLLVHYLLSRAPREVEHWPHRVKAWLTRSREKTRRMHQTWVEDARLTVAQADLVNLCNEDERAVLLSEGAAPEKIVVIPFGLNAGEFEALGGTNARRTDPPRVCFVGTFDGRKGGGDLPRILARVAQRVPGCQFRLLGTAGLHQTREAVLSFFPPGLRDRLEIVPHYPRSELAQRLDGCALGVFPSYFEGFPFGVLEMLAAGLPVVAYRSPGPPETLTDDLLVPPGDVDAMADRVVALLGDEPARARTAAWARARARAFTWEAAARTTDACYRRLCGQTPPV